MEFETPSTDIPLFRGASSYEYNVVDFSESLTASFIGSDKEPDERYAPRIVSNDENSGASVLSVIKGELANCIRFDFSVAFISSSGIQVLAQILSELKKRNIPGRILTSTYLNFNDPEALRKLLEYPNIEVRVYQGDLHAKGYFFDKDEISTIIIGSSNLTQTALTCNKEWNLLFRSFPGGQMLKDTNREFEKLWEDNETAAIDARWIDEYEEYLSLDKASRSPRKPAFSQNIAEQPAFEGSPIKPNAMQKLALEALDKLHGVDEPRALLVSATGTGKTYLSALDVLRVKPAKVLFVAHRKRILEASLKSFQRVLGDTYSYGIYDSSKPTAMASCSFAMVNTLTRHLDRFDQEEFDYLIIDEAHRTGADSYLKILDYFKPKFCLGMTATPSRTDGYDVYGLFNHVIAYRITLKDALENDMLVPFHYFGIADLVIDEEECDDLALFSKLTSEERVDHIISKIEEYSVRKSGRRGLIFCSRNEEAARLSALFNERGYRTVAISGETDDKGRDRAIERLESGEIEYIFSVDIFNEGIDIPSVNQVIMLRKTESAIIFVQQLGRGLRKHSSKEYTLVLDFIGNYQQNYLIPIALSDDRSYNKDNLRRVVKEGDTVISGCTTIEFDRISGQRVFKALDEGRFSDARLIRNEYLHLKQLLGRIPALCDFDSNEAIDPLIIIDKYKSYPAFLMKYEKECPFEFSERRLDYLKFISTKLASGKRRVELQILDDLLRGSSCRRGDSERDMSAIRMLTGEFSTKGEEIVSVEGGQVYFSKGFSYALENKAFRSCVVDVVEFALSRNERFYSDLYADTDFCLNAKYTREEVCRFLHWEKEPNYQNIGGYFHDKRTNTFPVFVNYEKDPSISITTQYEDRFLSEKKLIAISKSKRTLTSPEILMLKDSQQNGIRPYLFVRKNKEDKDNSTEFYFLGSMMPTGEFEEIIMADGKTRAIEIGYELDQPVRADLYDYFLSSFSE